MSARPLVQVGKLHLSAGVAELRSEDDATSLFERADEALYRAKERGKGQVVSHQPELKEANGDSEAANAG